MNILNASSRESSKISVWVRALQTAGVILVVFVYLPFLNNQLIFDDLASFLKSTGSEYAKLPWSLAPRTFPYFTLSFVHVLFGSIEAQRIVSLWLHLVVGVILCSVLARMLAFDKQSVSLAETGPTQRIVAVLVSTAFLVHPVAVYGAGYLIERTIVLATLFALLCIGFFLDSLRTNNVWNAVLAALSYIAAVFCKEHAIMVLPVTLAIGALYVSNWQRQWRLFSVLGLVGLSAMLWVAAYSSGFRGGLQVVGVVYEPIAEVMSRRMQDNQLAVEHPWVFSIGLQCELFFRYIYFWLTGDITRMSVDVRVDIRHVNSISAVAMRVAAFSVPLVAIGIPKIRSLLGKAISGGIVYLTLMFLVELSTVRIQEPFVLYRSYLWAPGVTMVICGLLCRLKFSITIALFTMGLPWLVFGAVDRLESMRSEETVWADARAKLQDVSLPGAERVLFHRGGYLAKHGQLEEGLAYMDQVISLQPNWWRGYMGRALMLMEAGRLSEGLQAADRAVELAPAGDGERSILYLNRARLLQQMGRNAAAVDDLAIAAKLGNESAKFWLSNLQQISEVESAPTDGASHDSDSNK